MTTLSSTPTTMAKIVASSGHDLFDKFTLGAALVAAVGAVLGLVAAWIALHRSSTFCRLDDVWVLSKDPENGRLAVRISLHIVPGGAAWTVRTCSVRLSSQGKEMLPLQPFNSPRTAHMPVDFELHGVVADPGHDIDVRIAIKFQDGKGYRWKRRISNSPRVV